MKQYRLLKDIPFVKAGEILEIYHSDDKKYLHIFDKNREEIYKFKIGDNVAKMHNEWFEEVEEYYVINPVFGEILKTKDNSYSDLQIRNMRELGVLFDTWLEADRKLAYLKAKAIIRQDTKGFKPEWNNNGEGRYCGFWDSDDNKPNWKYGLNTPKEPTIYFKTRQDILDSFEKHRKEWKTYLTYEQ